MFDDVILIDKRKKCFNVGRVFRMRKKGKNNRRFEIKGFITEEELSQIIFNIQLYEERRTNRCVVSTNVIEYSSSPSVVLNGKVNLCFNPDDETYELMDDVRDQIQTILTPKKVIEIPNASNSSNHSNDDVPDGIVIQPTTPATNITDEVGCMRTVIGPAESGETASGVRKSKWRRTQISYVSEFSD